MLMPNAAEFALTEGRWDLYGPVHKGLRCAHGQLLARLGAADFRDAQDALLDGLAAHLAVAAQHLAHEEEHIHGALEARAPGAASALDDQHGEHRDRLAELAARIKALRGRAGEASVQSGRELYLAFARFVAEDFEHMTHEETVVWPKLCALFTDAELMEIEMAIVGSLAPDEMLAIMAIMIPAMNRTERTGLLGGMKAGAPPEAYEAVLAHAVRPTLSADNLAHLQAAGLA